MHRDELQQLRHGLLEVVVEARRVGDEGGYAHALAFAERLEGLVGEVMGEVVVGGGLGGVALGQRSQQPVQSVEVSNSGGGGRDSVATGARAGRARRKLTGGEEREARRRRLE